MVIMTLGPFILSSTWSSTSSKFVKKKELANQTFGWFLFMTFLILPSFCTTISSNFACGDFHGGYGSYVKVDYSIDCDSANHRFFELYAYACIGVYPIGVPLMQFFLLKRMRHLLNLGQKRLVFEMGERAGLKAALEERDRLDPNRRVKAVIRKRGE
ncbi:hypothetical protein TL16_g10710 [Triparma laevis f. inornata]|uniref:Uncharacterized protein n=1 Tax=Triparma laevis f. inornata TaxID=1714386 RepID=A0A9W7BHI3_9STRA|nr:hypothetical protein TL16_g10710 [Triparma laevis f. inornata]